VMISLDSNPRLYSVLLQIDKDLATETREMGCRARLVIGNYFGFFTIESADARAWIGKRRPTSYEDHEMWAFAA
jgi:hypothetical protein